MSQRPDRGATNSVRKRAQQTAMAAVRGKLFKIRYDYVVLDDPDGNGFLVYALGKGSKPGDTVVHGHFVLLSPPMDKKPNAWTLFHTLC